MTKVFVTNREAYEFLCNTAASVDGQYDPKKGEGWVTFETNAGARVATKEAVLRFGPRI